MDFGLDSRAQGPVTVAGLSQPTVDVEAVRQPPTMNMVPDITVLPRLTSPTPDLQPDHADLTVEGTIQLNKKTSGSNRTPYKAKRGCKVKLPARAKAKVAVRGTKPRWKTRLAEALSRAAILTHGDPSEAIQDSSSLRRNCRPLAFVTMNKFCSPQRRATEDDDTILDPDSKNEDGGPPDKSSRLERPRDGHPPLVLVPVREAEAAYSALFS